MKVRDATLLGFLTGLGMSMTSFALIDQIIIVLTILAALSILFGKQIITGPFGGFLVGFATGFSLGQLLFKVHA